MMHLPAPVQEKVQQVASGVADEADEYQDQVADLARGDWVEFRSEVGQPLLARLAWRSPERFRMLFVHRDSTPAWVRTPTDLAEEFRTGRAKVAVEAVPLFERALTCLLDEQAEE